MSSKQTRSIQQFIRENGGAAALEAAVLLPFLLVLGLGTIEFGWGLAQIESAQSGLRDAARYVSRAQLVAKSNGTYELSQGAETSANLILQQHYAASGIQASSLNFTLVPVSNTSGAFRGGPNIYVVKAETQFTPASVGLLALLNIELPAISLTFEVRHVGG